MRDRNHRDERQLVALFRKGNMALIGPPAIVNLSPERVIALCRAAISMVALLAFSLVPGQLGNADNIVLPILIGYAIYAGILTVASFLTIPGFGMQIATHVVDVATFAVLMHLVEGPTSPYFVFFTFALFVAALRWNWRGVMLTTVVLVLLFLAQQLAAAGVPAQDTDRIVIRSGYLLIAGAILSYLGALRERARDRIAKLAAWPAEAEVVSDDPPLEKTLAHAASVIGAGRVFVAWESADEPYVFYAWLDENGYRLERAPPPEEPLVPDDLAREPFLIFDPADDSGWPGKGLQIVRDRALGQRSPTQRRAANAAVAPLRAARISGYLVLMDIGYVGVHLSALTEIVASRIVGQIEHHLLRQEAAAAAAMRERVRLARDVHDSSLQTLTAIGLRLVALREEVSKKSRPAVEELRQVVSAQQRRLRDFVSTTRIGAGDLVDLKPMIGLVLSEVAAQWRCVATLRIDPPSLRVTESTATELSLMLMEAVANAVRHGGATRIDVAIVEMSGGLQLEIGDDGRGFCAVSSSRGTPPLGPRALHERVRELGGTMRLADLPAGSNVKIELPLVHHGHQR